MSKATISQVAESTPFDNATNGYTSDNVQDAIEEGVTTAIETPIYTIILQHNGSVSGNTFIGYDSLIPGDDTPVIVPKNCSLTGFTFSNERTNADYALEFRKNTTGGAAFFTVSKDNTQFFNQVLPTAQSFTAGDQIYVKYIDEGQNASDAVILLTFNTDAP